MPDAQTMLLDALRSRLDQALDFLKRLVDVNSFTANREGVNRVAGVMAEMFAEMGFAAELVDSDHSDYGQHLFLRRRLIRSGTVEDANEKSLRPVVLVTHSDTVFPPEEEQRNEFHWQESPGEGRIYGPGTVDNKGGTALIWLLLWGIRKVWPDVFAQTDWLIAANASEEVVADDFARRVKERCPAGARAVLVFEGGPRQGSEYHIVTARKGRAEFRLMAHGRAAHAGSSHHEGANAVVALAEAVKAAAAITDYERDLTVNVATIHGGTVLNRVPHEAAAGMEVRAFEPAALQLAEARLQSIAAGHHASEAGVRFDLECLGRTAAWPTDERTLGMFHRWQTAAAQLGVAAIAVRRGGLSDANYLSDLGPILDGLGPAGANAHCSRRSADGREVPEFVHPDSFVPKAAMNALALADWLNGN